MVSPDWHDYLLYSTGPRFVRPGRRPRSRTKNTSVPLVIGDMPTRWSIAILLPIWSLLAPAFWQLDLVVYLLPLTLSALISMRILGKRAVADDKITFRMWNAWILTVYVLPIMRTFGH